MHDVIMISGIIRIILGLYNFIVISLLDIRICSVPSLVWVWKESY